MKNLTFIPGDGSSCYAYFKATKGFRLHLEFPRKARTATCVGVRSTSEGRYDEGWSTTGHTIDKYFSLTDSSELYIRVFCSEQPTSAKVSDAVTVSSTAQ